MIFRHFPAIEHLVLVIPRVRRVIVCNTTFNIISVISLRPVLLVEVTRVLGENHNSAASHWQTLSRNVVSSKPCLSGIRTHNFCGDSTDCIGNYKSN
jgi:hypothetical protein